MPPRARRPLSAHARPGNLGRQRDLRPRARAGARPDRHARVHRSRAAARTRRRGGLPTVIAERYPSSTTTVGRLVAMGGATLRPSRLRSLLGEVDVVHYPLTVPVPRPAEPHVITLLDVQHLDLPELFPRGERLFRKLAYDRASRRATEVIVISEFVRERVDRAFPARPRARPRGVARCRPCPLHAGTRGCRASRSCSTRRGRGRTRITRGCSRPSREIRRRRPELRLLLTGVGHDPRTLPDGVDARTVTGDELVDLYRRAACLVFPSLYEGFGLPPVEAMACGCPVAAAMAGSLPEVCGDAAVLFDPLSPRAIADGVDEALERSEELSERGLRRSATFTWDETARAHDRIYSSFS